MPFVAGVLRLRIEKDGYEPIDDLYWNRLFESEGGGYVLREPGERARRDGLGVPPRRRQLQVAAAPAGIHMPGVEHLPPPDAWATSSSTGTR